MFGSHPSGAPCPHTWHLYSTVLYSTHSTYTSHTHVEHGTPNMGNKLTENSTHLALSSECHGNFN